MIRCNSWRHLDVTLSFDPSVAECPLCTLREYIALLEDVRDSQKQEIETLQAELDKLRKPETPQPTIIKRAG